MIRNHLLSWIIFAPTIGALIVLLIPSSKREVIKWIAMATTIVTFLLSIWMWSLYDPAAGTAYGDEGALQMVERAGWISSFNIEYFLGLDGINLPLVILTTLVTMLAMVASWNINKATKGYCSLFLFLETGMLGTFLALDFFLFYVFWEIMLFPMYFLIGIWGGPRKEYAAIKFFLYTLMGSILMLIALLGLFFVSRDATGTGSFDLIELASNPTIQNAISDAAFMGFGFAQVMFALLFIGFAVKVPIFPFHTWLPDAHVEAPTPISVILAGVLLKMGGYGFFRISYPIFPEAAEYFSYAIGILGVVNIIYGALCAMAQTDFKKLVAYSSVSHMGFVMLGLALMTEQGYQGAMFQMIAHGVSSAMMFLLVGVVYDRAHHREIAKFGGLWSTMPLYGGISYLGFFASMGLPGLCGFIGEFVVFFAAFNGSGVEADLLFWRWCAIISVSGIILTASYILWTLQRVYMGQEKPEYRGFPEVNKRELVTLIPLGVLAIVLGIFPAWAFFQFVDHGLQLLTNLTSQVQNLTAVIGG